MILGKKTIIPIIKAVIAVIKTAEADKSLIFLMLSWRSGETKSDRFSMTELNASLQKTNPIAKITAIHS